jgi:hypothetical protein
MQFDFEQMRRSSLWIATPMYGGQCFGTYAQSMISLAVLLTQEKIDFGVDTLLNESLITRARNFCVQNFLKSQATHLLFIDSDISFDARDVLMMLALMGKDSSYDVLAGPYPKKSIAWEKVQKAVEREKGRSDPRQLAGYGADFVLNTIKNEGNLPLDVPVEVEHAGTGFMMIKRRVFEAFEKAYSDRWYYRTDGRSGKYNEKEKITAFFDCVIDPQTKTYLSEDYMFCDYYRKIGGKIWMCPWIKLEHTGTYVFGGSLEKLKEIDTSYTL